jgi:Crinkler effector protein N-terminal domain
MQLLSPTSKSFSVSTSPLISLLKKSSSSCRIYRLLMVSPLSVDSSSQYPWLLFPFLSPDVSYYVFALTTQSAPTTIASTWSAYSNLSDLSKTGKQSAAVSHSIIGSDDQFSLFCWVLNTSDRPFSVDIWKDKIVDNLKEAIKSTKKHAFAGIDYDTRNLWKVSERSWCELMRRSDIREAISTHCFF